MKLREAKQSLLRMHAYDLSMDSTFLIRHSGQESRASKLFMRNTQYGMLRVFNI